MTVRRKKLSPQRIVQVIREKKRVNRLKNKVIIDEHTKMMNSIEEIKDNANFLFTRISEENLKFITNSIINDEMNKVFSHEWQEMDINVSITKENEDFQIFNIVIPGNRVDKDFLVNTAFLQQQIRINGFRKGKMDLAFVYLHHSAKIEENIIQEYMRDAHDKVMNQIKNKEFKLTLPNEINKNQDGWSFEIIAHKENVNIEQIREEYKKETNEKQETKQENVKKTTDKDIKTENKKNEKTKKD